MGLTQAPEALELLHEEDGLPAYDLPDELRRLYGGVLGFVEPRLFANFVSTVDGVVAIPSERQSNRLIRGTSEGDRLVMALLRACADCVLVGSGTLRGSPRSIWAAGDAYPPAAPALAELRRRRGRPPNPAVAVLTASGSVDVAHPALGTGALVLTTERGAARLEGRLPAASEAVPLPGDDAVDLGAALGLLRLRGFPLVLSEAGPHVLGSLLAGKLVDELFLTLSPVLAGRSPASERLSLVEGAELLPGADVGGRLLSVRRQGEHLFLRYALERA